MQSRCTYLRNRGLKSSQVVMLHLFITMNWYKADLLHKYYLEACESFKIRNSTKLRGGSMQQQAVDHIILALSPLY